MTLRPFHRNTRRGTWLAAVVLARGKGGSCGASVASICSGMMMMMISDPPRLPFRSAALRLTLARARRREPRSLAHYYVVHVILSHGRVSMLDPWAALPFAAGLITRARIPEAAVLYRTGMHSAAARPASYAGLS